AAGGRAPDRGRRDVLRGGAMKGLAILAGAALAATAITATAAQGGSTGATRAGTKSAATVVLGGTLRAARAADAVMWDPAHINENDSLWAAYQTNANLIMTTPDGKGFQPYIAKSWTTSKGGRVFT